MLSISVVTPAKVLFDTVADFVVIPGRDGEVGILPGHARTVVQVTAGKLRVQTGGGECGYAVGEGYAMVTPERVVVSVLSASDL